MKNNIENKIQIFVYRAIDEIAICHDYIKGHQSVLIDYGIENITTNNEEWIYNPNVYCIVARDMCSKELIGGTRIQIGDGIHPLPVEEAIGGMDRSIHQKIRDYGLNGGVGESCGLWISKNAKGLGVSRYLMWAAISSANQLKFETMLGICAAYTLNLFNDIGFQVDSSLGAHGEFPYPSKKYIANVIGILDTLSVKTASVEDKQIIFSLRENNQQERVETNKKGMRCEVLYSLNYEKSEKVKYKI